MREVGGGGVVKHDSMYNVVLHNVCTQIDLAAIL